MTDAAAVVVGVVVRRGGLVLAARRREGWELPGGKVEPGEDPAATAIREIREELGCEVAVTGWLVGAVPVRPGLELWVATAVLVAGEPRPLEHAELRWLAPADLDDLDWLPADRPFVAQLREG